MNDYLQNQFSGNIRPIRPKRSENPPYFEVPKLKIGQREQRTRTVWNTLRLFCTRPTFQYPKSGIFLSLNTGKQSSSALITLSDIGRIIEWFSLNIDEFTKQYTDVTKIGEDLEKEITNFREKQDAIIRLSNQAINPEDIEDINEEDLFKLQRQPKTP